MEISKTWIIEAIFMLGDMLKIGAEKLNWGILVKQNPMCTCAKERQNWRDFSSALPDVRSESFSWGPCHGAFSPSSAMLPSCVCALLPSFAWSRWLPVRKWRWKIILRICQESGTTNMIYKIIWGLLKYEVTMLHLQVNGVIQVGHIDMTHLQQP